MERLTQMGDPGLGYCWTKLAFSDVAIMEDMIIDRLGAYEDTGLTPEEIMVMQKEKLERDKGCEYCCGKHYTERKSIADKNIEVLIDTDNTLYVYANSLMVNPKINYCPMCGRKLVEA